METFKIGILEPDNFSELAIADLRKIGSVELYENGDLSSFIEDKSAIFIRLKYLITDDLIRNASNLKYICSPTTGLNHIKISDPNIQIVSLKGEDEFLNSIRATPEHVFGLTLALLRNYAHSFMKEGNCEWNRDKYRGYELYGNTVGIIGMGRIGKLLTKYFNAFDCNVNYCEIKGPCPALYGATYYDNIKELIEHSNIIILETNWTPENDKMIDEGFFRLMEGKYFINAARGELVDENALIQFIREDHFNGVAIDVIADETRMEDTLTQYVDLTKSHNLIVTPHIGGATFTSMHRTEEFVVLKMARLAR